MKGVQLKLQGEWLVMPPGFSIKLQQLNPVFNEEGVFSFPFEVPIEPNRHLFKNISDPFGNVKLKDIDGMEAELWFNGVLLYRGIIETEQEIEFGDTIPMTFLSGNSDFLSKIEGLNAQDVPLDREIKLGYVVTKALVLNAPRYDSVNLPERIMMNYTEFNVSDPYPIKKFCNVRVFTSDENGKYKTLEAKRPYSGVCFYVLYFLDCLFEYLNISIRDNNLTSFEDMCRLAFFTTKCHVTTSKIEKTIPLSEIKSDDFCGSFFSLQKNTLGKIYYTDDFIYSGTDVFATEKNFPETTVKNIIDDMRTAFGVRFIYDVYSNNLDMIYLKDVLSDTSNLYLDVTVLNVINKKDKGLGVSITYGVSDNTAFNYNDYENVELFPDYTAILNKGVYWYQTACRIDEKTGNAYRVKVNKETGGAPSLFEVGGFRDYKINYNSKDNNQDYSISFSPIILNTKLRQIDPNDPNKVEIVYASFVDVELNSKEVFKGDLLQERDPVILLANFPEYYNFKENEESPLQSYDAGYSLGIMRGPGNESGVEYVENYDGEGNDSWVQIVSDYAFTSDSCDNYGRFFDYNGTEAGGADQSGRFSLKLVAGKEGFPIGSAYANRGLVDKFLSEYFYFLENRKTVMLEVDMSITQLLNINFLKRYKIGDFVGFINGISYTLTVDGMENVVIEMYTL